MHRSPSVLLAALALTACAATPPPDVTAAAPSPPPPDGCPASYDARPGEPRVPAPPTTETSGRLVPDADPVEALVCRYGDASTRERVDLEGEVTLSAGLERVRTDLLVPERLPGQQRVCFRAGGPVVPHLVRLRYADGELWLAAVQEPDGCTDTGNGAHVSSAYLGDRVAQAYDARAWTPTGATPAPCRGGTGRAGQERTLVPKGWRSLVVCLPQDGSRTLDPATASEVVAVLDGVPTSPATGGCEGGSDAGHHLALTYDAGPAVRVRWLPGCEPSVSNGSLSGRPSAAQTARLRALLGG